MWKLPSAVLFCCTHNAVRSPMAEAMLKALHGSTIYVESAGARPALPDVFLVEIMNEIGLNLRAHEPRLISDLEHGFFDLIIALSPEALATAAPFAAKHASELESWSIFDPSGLETSRENKLAAYRAVRNELLRRLISRFPGGNSKRLGL